MDDWVTRNGHKVVSRETLRALSVKSDLRGWVQTLTHLGAILATGSALVLLTPLYPWTLFPLLIAHGILLNCLYAGLHETSHWTVFRTKWLNDVFGTLFGLITLNPFFTDRWAHFAHHRATRDPERDSEIMGVRPYSTLTYVLDLLALDFWRRRLRMVIRTALNIGLDDDYWLEADQRRFVILEARIYLAVWLAVMALSVVFQSWLAVELWIGPLLLTKVFHQFQNTGEHTCMTLDQDTFRNTRTLVGPPIVNWLVWNMSWHTAHHCYPGVPFFALPALHEKIVQNLPHPVPTLGYIAAQREIFARLRQADREHRLTF